MPRSAAAAIAAPTAAEPEIEIDADKSRLDFRFIHDFLKTTHWARDIPEPVLRRAIDNSLCFGLYKDGRQIGFARVVTDYATFAYLADVFIVAEERNVGLGQHFIESIMAQPGLQGLKRWMLVTRNAQNLYRRCGFHDPLPLYSVLERADMEYISGPGIRPPSVPASYPRGSCPTPSRRSSRSANWCCPR